MKIKNKEWINFKIQFFHMLEILGNETEKFDIPDETENFELYVSECKVNPVFVKKSDFLKVEYDFTLCDTKIRTLSLSMYKDAARIEMTLKDKIEGKDIICQESHY